MKRAMLLLLLLASPAAAQPLPGTAALTGKDDFAKVMVEGIERYLAKAAIVTAKERGKHWKPDLSSEQAFDKSVQPNRDRLRKMLGVIDTRLPASAKQSTMSAIDAAQTRYANGAAAPSVAATPEGRRKMPPPIVTFTMPAARPHTPIARTRFPSAAARGGSDMISF